MKTLLTLTAIAIGVSLLPEDMPTALPYQPTDNTDNPSQRVMEFVRGDRAMIDEADLFSPSVSEPLRKAAQNLID